MMSNKFENAIRRLDQLARDELYDEINLMERHDDWGEGYYDPYSKMDRLEEEEMRPTEIYTEGNKLLMENADGEIIGEAMYSELKPRRSEDEDTKGRCRSLASLKRVLSPRDDEAIHSESVPRNDEENNKGKLCSMGSLKRMLSPRDDEAIQSEPVPRNDEDNKGRRSSITGLKRILSSNDDDAIPRRNSKSRHSSMTSLRRILSPKDDEAIDEPMSRKDEDNKDRRNSMTSLKRMLSPRDEGAVPRRDEDNKSRRSSISSLKKIFSPKEEVQPRRHGKYYAYKIDDQLLIENEEGEVLRRYKIKTHGKKKSGAGRGGFLHKALSIFGIGSDRPRTTGEEIRKDSDEEDELETEVERERRLDALGYLPTQRHKYDEEEIPKSV